MSAFDDRSVAAVHPAGTGGTATMATDAPLVRLARAGDHGAFAKLVTRHQAALYRYARAQGFDHDTTCDCVQDAFIRAWRNLHRCRDSARFRAWLSRIMRNRCLDQRKAAHNRAVPLETVEPRAPSSAIEPDVGDAIRRSLNELPVDQREAFVMKHVEGWSYEEMADALDSSISALKMRVHRARDVLRRSLENAGHDAAV